ncbi:MAG: cobalamin biosynthesis protein CobW [Microcoleaceae cyanobacterium]
MSSKIPVTVITGFLGSGKTTMIKNLLTNNQGRRIAVIVNEFGEVGIDGDLLKSCQVCDDDNDDNNELPNNIIELNNGCLCCTVQEEFFPTMRELLKRREQIDHILIETSGLALPKPLVQAFKWPEIKTGATVDSVITVVDCQAIASGNLVGDINAINQQRAEDPNLDHETPIEELFEDQLGCADLVLLTKTDQVDQETQQRVISWLRSQLPEQVKIVNCTNGKISPDVLLGFNAMVEDNLDSRPSHHDHEEEHDHDDDINSVHLISDQEFIPENLVQELKSLMQSQEIFRIKGFVAVPEKPMRLVLQGVGDRLEYFYDRLWQNGEKRQTKLVFIGHNLGENEIKSFIKR